jgi:hypothetical protein
MNPKGDHHLNNNRQIELKIFVERFFVTCFQHEKILHKKMPTKACLFYVRSAVVLCNRDILALNTGFEAGYLE